MADGFEPYHVPQQSRRDKLRVNATADNQHLQACAALVPLYDPSLVSSDLINYAAAAANLRPQSFNTTASVKEEGMNLMNFGGGINSSNHMYVDPQLSVQLNPSPIQEISGVYPTAAAHCYRLVDDHHHHHHHQQSIAAHQEAANSSSCSAAATTGQSLSLSLSSHHSSLPLELNLQRYNSSSASSSMFSNHKVSSVPLGPFTGYASVLKGSRFLKPAQQLLEELCGMGIRGFYGDKTAADSSSSSSSLLDPSPLEPEPEPPLSEDASMNCTDGNSDQTRKKSRLLSMLDEVYKRYKQYYQQMQAAVAAFESVAGLSGAAPFANLALKAMSKHFTCLKNAITDQLRCITKSHGKTTSERDEALRLENSGRGTYSQRPFHTTGFNDQPVWRPQRGLPERAVAVLRAWLFEHFLHPYPTDTDKLMLAKQTGLSRNQVSNWFINARVRLWKPMVEEIHMLEMRETQKLSQRGENPPDRLNTDHLLTSCSIEAENASTSVQRIGDFPLKRSHEADNEAPRGNEGGQMKLPSHDNWLHNQHLGGGGGGGGMAFSNPTSSGNVSLTLGLHQNSMGIPDAYPINAARRFGLDSQSGEGFMIGGFAAENQQFGRSDHIGGHLVHEFVG
ncbi:BEL1-like homeodomain protein 9 [Andrographis paniculata]|uniref:BEL1-like homeodomain protein 9 n=1 Tax=Andrographis paniculata TaxID=175694 RepID=UPI0021E7DB6B|nr:BEL1-like homeodomain protein 9 [Andrographis paniculata]